MYKIFIYRIGALIILTLIITGWISNLSQGLFSFAIIALTLGLRHGLDADHIVAIDNITRKLTIEKRQSASTGLYFALGHSTIVFCLTIMIILGIHNSHTFYSMLAGIGDKVGSLISISFLCLTLLINIIAFKALRNLSIPQRSYPGFIFTFASRYLFNSIDRPEKMFIVGFFFGLGFDTATEVGLLSMAASSMMHGLNPGYILLLPLMFACGMIFTDTLNSIFMSKVYQFVKDSSQKLCLYNYLVLGFATMATLVVIIVEILDYTNEYIYQSNLLSYIINGLTSSTWLLGVIIISGFILLWIVVQSLTGETKKDYISPS